MTPLKRPEYAKIKISDIPDEIIKKYRLHARQQLMDVFIWLTYEECMVSPKQHHWQKIC